MFTSSTHTFTPRLGGGGGGGGGHGLHRINTRLPDTLPPFSSPRAPLIKGGARGNLDHVLLRGLCIPQPSPTADTRKFKPPKRIFLGNTILAIVGVEKAVVVRTWSICRLSRINDGTCNTVQRAVIMVWHVFGKNTVRIGSTSVLLRGRPFGDEMKSKGLVRGHSFVW